MIKNIIFLMQIKSEQDFARFGNLVNKITEHKELDLPETSRVRYRSVNGMLEPRRICQYTLLHKEEFSKIKNPQDIKKIGAEFRLIFVMDVAQADIPEVAQYRAAMLLQIYFRELDVYSLICGENSFYFKISQYMHTCVEQRFLNDKIYYLDLEQKNNSIKRLAEKNVQSSTAFFPLLVIDEKSARNLKDSCVTHLGEMALRDLSEMIRSRQTKKIEEVKWRELGGAVKLWSENINRLVKIDTDWLESLLNGVDTLTFILLSYSLKDFAKLKQQIDRKELKNYIELLKQYSNAYHQLLENIIFHSENKWGLLSIRVHSSTAEDVRKLLYRKYGLYEGDPYLYLEVEICDFSGRAIGKNISQNFCEKLNEENKRIFKGMLPEDLFRSSLDGTSKMTDAWKYFYSKPENMGKHFGLRIFQRIVAENQGRFIAESHSGYINQDGDCYRYRGNGIEDRERFCMPGTTYQVLLPLNRLQSRMIERDVTQEYGDWLRVKGKELIGYQGHEICTPKAESYDTQQEKNKIIACIAEEIAHARNKVLADVYFMDVSGKRANEAELWAKGIMLAEYQAEGRAHMVLYHCADDFLNQFWMAIVEMFRDTGIAEMFREDDTQIILVTPDQEQVVFILNSLRDTDCVNNYISRLKGIQCDKMIGDEEQCDYETGSRLYIPFDVIDRGGRGHFFEKYLMDILFENIQTDKMGCQITDTHMRLGSTIHIDRFYEGELMFGGKYFLSRFAFLILKDVYEELKQETKVTFYGYASYSEALLVELCCVVRKWLPELDVDYIILEREEEQRGFSHTDRIRYNITLENEDRKKYIRERQFILIVPINSTLKTHQRLISLLMEENEMEQSTENWILRNYAIILVGSERENPYWKKDEKKKVLFCNFDIKPEPRYFIEVKTDYQEALECKMCYPEKPIDEKPLIEVNAASTIPNQAFGIIKDTKVNLGLEGMKSIIKDEEKKVGCLKEHLLYGHMERNDSHYLYYICTERLLNSQRDKIEKSLLKWKKNILIRPNEYHVIVAPMHYSNSGFMELVNETVFDGMAMILRIDFNKDFRSNVFAKYSNIRQYLTQLDEMSAGAKVKFHYVDDSIITGRTFWRAKSLIESMTDCYGEKYENVEIVVFDKVFILVDRNSRETRLQYVPQDRREIDSVDKTYYTYIQLEISSIRTYGDSCVLCNLKKDADLLYNTASTQIVYDYWSESNEKFALISVEQAMKAKEEVKKKAKEEKDNKEERAFRRLFCTHMSKIMLDKVTHGNDTANVLLAILRLLNADFALRDDKKAAFEYFVSYLKVISRPFLVFQKAVREAIFDLLLIFSEWLIKKETIGIVLRGTGKIYLKEQLIRKELNSVEKNILNTLTDEQKMDLMLVLMKQLCELKSNYIIRKESMGAFFRFALENTRCLDGDKREEEREDFFKRYIVNIKKLTGISTDTSKSLWIDIGIIQGNYKPDISGNAHIDKFLELMILENTRNFRDGIRKLYEQISKDKEAVANLEKFEEDLNRPDYMVWCCLNILENKQKSWGDWQSKERLDEYLKESPASIWLFDRNNIEQLLKKDCDVKETWGTLIKAAGRTGYVSQIYISEINEQMEHLKVVYQRSAMGFQYQNFLMLLEHLGWWEKGEITTDGAMQLTACLEIKRLCNKMKETDNEEQIWNKMKRLTHLFSMILQKTLVHLIMESEDGSQYYKQVILEQLSKKRMELKLDEEENVIEIDRYYEIVRSSSDEELKTAYTERMERSIQKDMNAAGILEEIEKYGYFLNEYTFVWKLGKGSKYPTYLYAKFAAPIDTQMKFCIRNVLMFSKELEENVFGRKEQEYLHELVLANRRLKVYRGEKVYSHTPEDVRDEQYQNLINSIRQNGENEDEHTYLSSILRLLSDMNVSSMFRKSLYREFYQNSVLIEDMSWEDEMNILNEFEYIDITSHEEGSPVRIHIRNEAVLEGDSCLGENDSLAVYGKAEREVVLLIVSLVLNVLVKENDAYRGVPVHNEMDVYLSKTKDNCIRITNKTAAGAEILELVKRCLEREPNGDGQGITLWSVQAYIRRIIASYAISGVNKVKNGNDYKKVKDFIRDLTEQMFDIKVDITDFGDELYFWYKIPLLHIKYEELEPIL